MHGEGHVTTESGVLKNVPYRFAARYADELGLNPEELLGAAYASCFVMAFSNLLKLSGFVPTRLETVASVSFENIGGVWNIVRIHLDCVAAVPLAEASDVGRIANEAKDTCSVSRVLSTVITLKVTMADVPRASGW